MRLIREPNLPERSVCLCAVSAGQPYILDALDALGIQAVTPDPCDMLQPPVRYHTDLLLHHAGGDKLWLAEPDGVCARSLAGYGYAIRAPKKPLRSAYPGDVAFCCFVTGNILFCKPNAIDEDLLNYYQSVGKKPVYVTQGYTKCSVCIVNENSAITADAGLARQLERQGVEVLVINTGHVVLPGYSYGFIGGCSGLLKPDKLAFYGDISAHPDYQRMRAFCKERGVEMIMLCKQLPLTDIGGILPLAEI